ncbi:Fc.00g077520.m01.CDS01 [Cosmosporella sp. VM-42]
MANVDASTFTSSSEIFAANHTLPQIRSIHKALHVQIEEKSTRLRTQVGSSYRELLGTADTIVQMRGDNNAVQELLGKMGGQCGRAVIGAKASGLARFVSTETKSDTAVAARLRLLDACLLVVGRILKGGGGLDEGLKKGDRLVLATKVLVLSRLLSKNMAAPKLGNLRRRLLRSVEKMLEKAGEESEREDVLKALCAYSLATSSGARDVLRHFLHVRGEALALAFEVEESGRKRSTEDVVRGLKLYTRTLLDVQALVPGKLSHALAGLKGHPLLADRTLKQLEGLRLDVYERWCGEEIQYFTPFIRHDDLDGRQAREMLMGWSDKVTRVLLDGLKQTLEQMSEFKAIMDLRTNVLQLWIRDGGKARGIDPSEMQDELRDAINARILAVLDIKVSKLRLVGSEVSATLGRWKDGITDDQLELWSDEGYDEALSKGAAPFVQEVVSRLYGRNDAVSKAAHCYRSWYHVINDVKEVVESLRKQRWDNDYDEIEDEETIEARQQLLSKDDPQVLQERLDATLDKSFKELEEQMQKMWDERSSAANNGRIAMYFIRVLRDIRYQLPERPAIKTFGLAMVPSLHRTIAISTTTGWLRHFSQTELTHRRVAGRPLWEGEPPLPNQPSPEVFQFLSNLSLSMTYVGVDLWTEAAVKALKQRLSKVLCEMWLEALADVITEGKTEPSDDTKEKMLKEADDGNDINAIIDPAYDVGPEEEEEEEEKEIKDEEKDGLDHDATAADVKAKPAIQIHLSPVQMTDLFTQWLFDISFLRCCIGSPTEGTRDEFKSLEEMVYERTKLDSASARQRIIKSSNDFWNRTNLLFGLLA